MSGKFLFGTFRSETVVLKLNIPITKKVKAMFVSDEKPSGYSSLTLRSAIVYFWFVLLHMYSNVNSSVLVLTLLYRKADDLFRNIPSPSILISEVIEMFFILASSSN